MNLSQNNFSLIHTLNTCLLSFDKKIHVIPALSVAFRKQPYAYGLKSHQGKEIASHTLA